MERLDAYAEKLDTAALTATDTPQISIEDNSFTVDEAYQVQAKSIDRRYARGEKRIGIKMGLTSRAKMMQLLLLTSSLRSRQRKRVGAKLFRKTV